MSASLMMSSHTATDIICGNIVTTDIIAQKTYPEQQLVGNHTLLQRTLAVAGDEVTVESNSGLLEATPEEVMAWMTEGIDGITLSNGNAGLDLDLLDVGPDVDTTQLLLESNSGHQLITGEAVDARPLETTPQTEAIYACEPEYAQVSETDSAGPGECWSDEREWDYHKDEINTATPLIALKISEIINNLGERLSRTNAEIDLSQETREKIIDVTCDFFSARLSTLMGKMLGPMYQMVGEASGELTSEIISTVTNDYFVTPVTSGVADSIRSQTVQENNQTVTVDFIDDFVLSYSNGVSTGLHNARFAVFNSDEHTMVAYSMLLKHLINNLSSLQEAVSTSAIDSFLIAASESTTLHQKRRDGGDIGSEIYQLEVVPCGSMKYWGRPGFAELRPPEAVPGDKRDEYMRTSTLRGRRLILATGTQGNDISHVDFDTTTCEVRGIGGQDPRTAVNGSLFQLVKAYFPDEYDRLNRLTGEALVPEGDGGQVDAAYRYNSQESYVIQHICEEALRLWFVDSIAQAGGLDTPLAELNLRG